MAPDRDTKTLRVGLITPPHHLDPRDAQDFVSTFVLAQVYETPYAPPTGNDPPEPMLFSEPLRLESGAGERQIYSAPVRRNVTFSDGTALTAERVARSLRDSRRLAEHAEIEARGGRVVFRLTRPNARFDLVLTQRYASVLLEQDGELTGTGPYTIASDNRPDRVRLIHNPRYRNPVDIEEIVFTTYPADEDGRPTALVRAVEQGEVDFTNVLSREDIGGLRGVRKWLEPGSSTAILYFNTEHRALSDRQVRNALAHAIDRKAITKSCYPNPLTFTATSLLPPLMGRWQDEQRYDPERAKDLLAESEATKPERLTLLPMYGPRPYLPSPRRVADLVAEQIGVLGIEVVVAPPSDSDDYYGKLSKGDYDLVLAGWIADSPDPAEFLEAVLAPESIPSPGRRIVVHSNLSRWRDDEMTEALARFRADSSDAARDEIRDLVARDVPLVALMYGSTIYVYTPRMTELDTSPLGIPLLYRSKMA